MKRILVSLLTVSLIAASGIPACAEDLYGEEITDLYSWEESPVDDGSWEDGAACDKDLSDLPQENISDEQERRNFEAALNNDISLYGDDFPDVSGTPDDNETANADNESGALSAEFESALNDDSIKLSETGIDGMNLVSSRYYDLDSEYSAEIDDYESIPAERKASSTVSTVEHARKWRIYRNTDNATMVQWVLRGIFIYDGNTSRCKETAMNCDNSAPDIFRVTEKSHYSYGMYAVGGCSTIDRKTGKAYARTIRFGVTRTGNVV